MNDLQEFMFEGDGVSTDGQTINVDTIINNLQALSDEALDTLPDCIDTEGGADLLTEIFRVYKGLNHCILPLIRKSGVVCAMRNQLCKEYIASLWQKLVESSHGGNSRAGYVYAFLFSDGMVKIGRSGKNTKRHKQFADRPQKIVAYTYFPTANMYLDELICHRHFAQARVYGEFFNIGYETASAYICNVTTKYDPVTRTEHSS